MTNVAPGRTGEMIALTNDWIAAIGGFRESHSRFDRSPMANQFRHCLDNFTAHGWGAGSRLGLPDR
jgi:hypothetical protein